MAQISPAELEPFVKLWQAAWSVINVPNYILITHEMGNVSRHNDTEQGLTWRYLLLAVN
jgi:hypothetical protein